MRGVDRIARAAAVDESERRVVGLVALVFAAIEAGRGLGDVGVNTLVLSRLPADALPYLYIVLGLGSLVIAIGFGALLGRMRKARLFAGTLWGVAVALVVERLLISTGSAAVLPVLWLTVVGAGTIATTICWTVATSTFDARQAKRLFPLCTSAAIAGYFIGSLVAGPLAASVGTESLVIAQALLFLAAGGLIGRVAVASGSAGWAPSRGVRRPITADVRAGFDEVRASPLMRLVAVAYVLFSVLAFSVTFPFLLAARQEFPAEAELATALGTLAAAVTATSFVLSLLFANRIYARFGVVGAALVLPLAYLVGFPVWIVSFTFATAAAFAYVQQSIQRGLSNAAWSAMYNVVPARTRSQVLTFQDGVPGQVGVALSGVLLLTAARVLAPDQLFWIGLAAAAALTAVVVLIRRHYTESLLTTLRSGAAEQLLEGGRGLDDFGQAAEVRAVLVAGLASPDPMQRRMSATLLARSTAPEARIVLASALRDEDPGLRATAASALLTAPAADDRPRAAEAEASLDALLRGGSTERVAGAQALRRLDRTLPADLVPVFATDPSEDVRSAAMSVLDEANDPGARAALVGGLSDRATVVRNAAADALAARPTLPHDVVGLLTADTSDVQAAALRAMVGHQAEVGPTVLEWASARATRAVAFADAEHHLRDGLGDGGSGGGRRPATGGPDGSAADAGHIDRIDETEFLCDVLARRIDRNTDLVLGAIAVLEAPEARGVIRRSLNSSNPDVRAQAVEVLDTIGDRRLGHALSRLAEPGLGHDRETRAQVMARLIDDDDPWISGLARRVGQEGAPVPDASPTLAHLETMLLLRRVPIFERLDPEDLARIAATAEERWFEPDEKLMREGDPGDELYVLVEGRVHVTRHEADGAERHVRDYGAGEHIGELAVLRDRPRAGTVVAGPQGVRALVIDGEGLKAILRERPDAAMAMLATLAERVTQ